MFTYDVVSESVRNPHELAAELTRRSSAGWEVIQITTDGGSWFHAFVRHDGQVTVTPYAGMKTPTDIQSPDTASTPPPTNTFGTTATASAPSNAAANWYKDPSSRFELRYWNGSAWTEHVATAGAQSIDPPQK